MNQGLKVLIVDDEKQFRATTKKILDRRGFETIVAATGEEAIDKMAEKPDVVILDIKMPGIDGIEALGRIKSISPETPVIMLTGHGGEKSARDALMGDAFDYLAKPCDIDLLSSKILDAHRQTQHPGILEERRVKDVMIPMSIYTTLAPESTIREALDRLRESFLSSRSTSRIMETGHRSLAVLGERGELLGMLTIVDLFNALMPAYLSAPKPSTADSIQYSPMFWKGMFSFQTRELAKRKIKEIMSPPPPAVDEQSNLMEAAWLMVTQKTRRLVVKRDEETIGVVREQDLFFEMERILRE